MPEGYKNFSKTKPILNKHFDDVRAWWNDRKEIIDEKTGLMINNEEELEKALKHLIENPKIRKELSGNLKEKVLNNFEWSKTSEKILKDLKKGVKEYE